MATTSSLNTSMFTVDSSGKLNVGGIASGINSKAIIDAQMQAKRMPVVQIEAKITSNTTKISALTDFKGKVSAVTTALNALRGNPGNSSNVFDSKTISGTTSAATGTASNIDSLIMATVSSSAQNMSHTIKVNSLAAANQIRTDAFSSTTTKLSDLGVTPGTMEIGGKTITISSSDTLLDLRSKINNSGAGVTASIVSSDSSTHYLVLTSSKTGTANAINFTGDATLSDGLGLTAAGGVKNELVAAANANIDVDGITGIERASNSIDDVISGVTLSLLKAEPGTTITLNVEPDLSAIKTGINDLVTAYNDVRAFMNDQRTVKDWNDDDVVGENEMGPLAYDQTMRDVVAQLSDLVAGIVPGATDGYASLGQIGIVMNSDYTLSIDNTILDNKLLTNPDGVKQLFSLQTNVSDSRVTFLNRGSSAVDGTYNLEITGTDADGNVTGATWNGVAMTVSGRTLTAADGTSLFFNGGPNLGPVSGMTVSISTGLAESFYNYFDTTTRTSSGTLDTQISDLKVSNIDYKDRVDAMDTRLAVTRTYLEAKYTAMETALAKLQTLQDTIKSFSDSFNNSNS